MSEVAKSWRRCAALAVLLLSGCASSGGGSAGKGDDPGAWAPGGTVTVSGTVAYRERMALVPGSTVEVVVEDSALADAPAKQLAKQTITPQGQVPVPFQLSVDTSNVEVNARTGLRASIKGPDGKLLFTTTTHEPVDLRQNSSGHALVLQRVSP
mgnify:CR=1 FL=1